MMVEGEENPLHSSPSTESLNAFYFHFVYVIAGILQQIRYICLEVDGLVFQLLSRDNYIELESCHTTYPLPLAMVIHVASTNLISFEQPNLFFYTKHLRDGHFI